MNRLLAFTDQLASRDCNQDNTDHVDATVVVLALTLALALAPLL